jgi:20S proteasome alpha/beta subunit
MISSLRLTQNSGPNSAFCIDEWDGILGPNLREEAKMTFTYAVISKDGIVLVADSQVTYTHRDKIDCIVGTYEGRRGKIRRIGDHSAFSIAGNGGLIDTLLARAGNVDESQPFEKIVQSYQEAFQKELQDKYQGNFLVGLEATFIFCGFRDANTPEIVKLDAAGYFQWNPLTYRGFCWSGVVTHGAALYLHHRFYNDRLSLEQAKLLAYCIAAEVADQDNSVGGPIEMEIITPDGSGPLTNLEKYEHVRQTLVATVRASLEAFR